MRFEVASIRPSQPGTTARDARINFRGDLFEVKAATVGDILDMLGGFQLFRVVGGPDWMRTDRYDIDAKADGPLKVTDQQQAVMALLIERFQLSVAPGNAGSPWDGIAGAAIKTKPIAKMFGEPGWSGSVASMGHVRVGCRAVRR